MRLLSNFRVVCLLTVLFTLGTSSAANAQLTAGQIMFVGFNADGNDGFAFVALVAIPAVTTIYFTDNNWNGTLLSAGEGTLTWNSGASIIPAGNVIVVQNTSAGALTFNFGSGTIVGSLNLNATGDPLYAYLGAPGVPTSFLSAISNGGFIGANTLVGTGLTVGVNATSFTGGPDVLVYTGTPACNVSVATCAAMIANPANWATDDGAGNQDTDLVFPDFPANVPLAPNVSVLPVELIYFTAERDESNRAKLNWATASEMNNDFFTIDWSSDGLVWFELKRILAVGNSSALQLYSTIDDRVFTENMYYRLTQTDFNGVSESFKVISLSGAQLLESEILIFPNPSIGTVNIIAEKVRKESIEIYDGIGRDCKNSAEIKIISENHIQLIFNSIGSSLYILKIGELSKKIQLN